MIEDIVYVNRDTRETIDRVTVDGLVPVPYDFVVLHGDTYSVRGRQPARASRQSSHRSGRSSPGSSGHSPD